jgi:hypothetical protein
MALHGSSNSVVENYSGLFPQDSFPEFSEKKGLEASFSFEKSNRKVYLRTTFAIIHIISLFFFL